MALIYEDKLVNICNNLDSILETLVRIKETMEQAYSSILIDDYFDILFAFEQIKEVKERLGKIGEKQKQEEGRKRNHGLRIR